MKKSKIIELNFVVKVFTLLFLILCTNVWSQTTIWGPYNGGSVPIGWTFSNNVSTNAVDQGTYWLVDAGNPSDKISTSSYDLCTYTSATVCLQVATFGSGSNNSAKIEVSYNGGSTYTDVFGTSTPTSSTYNSQECFNLTQTSNQVVIRISNNGTSGRGVRIKSFALTASGSGSCGSCTTPATPPAPSVNANPACSTATLSVGPSTVAGVTWYWQTSSSGTSTMQPTSSAYTTASTATVYVRAQDNTGLCWSLTTSSLAVTVNSGISISSCPTPSSVCEAAGTSVKFTANASGGGPYSNSWQVNTGSGYTTVIDGGSYSGASTNTLTINTTTLSAGVYSFQPLVSNACGTASCVTTLTVAAVPVAPPTPSIISTCNTAIISETVVGTPPPNVTWYWASNANAPVSYTSAVNDLSVTASGTIYIRSKSDLATCWNSTVTTNSVAVTVIKSPTITTQPSNTTACQGSNSTIKVTMSNASTTPLTYQWQENTGSGFSNISSGSPYTISVGTYTSTLDINGTKPIGTYTYQCIISNSCGTVTTNIVTVTVTATPSNDLCSNATSVTIDAAPVTGNLNCAGPTAGLSYVPSKNDVWYAFTPTCTATHTLSMAFTTAGADYDIDVFASACPISGNGVFTSHGTSTVETIAQTFTSGVTYYVRVLDYDASGGTFTIGVMSNCGTPHTVTFDPNGGTGVMSNQTSGSATSLPSNAFTNSGCTFVNWNDSANANGTSYANNAVYSFTADVTLYAQWNCSSGGGTTGCPYLVSAVVNACGGSCNTEGKNELVVMNSGNYAIAVNGTNINLYYSGGTNHYFTNTFAASGGTVITNLNTLAATGGCTNTPFIFVPSGGTIPANSNFMILNNNSCLNGDFSAYCNAGPIYVIISTDTDWYTGGYFGNNNTPRYFRTDFSSVNAACGLTTYNYNNPSTFSFGSDGASVVFNGTTPSYINGTGICAPSIAILPIELLDFYGTQNGAVNDLVWKVASEKNVSWYIVEKGEDGINFTELARLKAFGDENNSLSYSCEDAAPFSGITYYRLSTVENDQSVNYYKTIDLDRGNTDWKSIVYQENDQLIVEWKNYVPKNASLMVFDLSGKQLINMDASVVQAKINTSGFSTGIYFVKIESPYKTENFKLIIRK